MYMTITNKTGIEVRNGKINFLLSCFSTVLSETDKAERK